MRDIIRKDHENGFPLDAIVNQFKGTSRDHIFSEDNIANLLNIKYNSGDSLLVLSILYPWADLRNSSRLTTSILRAGSPKRTMTGLD